MPLSAPMFARAVRFAQVRHRAAGLRIRRGKARSDKSGCVSTGSFHNLNVFSADGKSICAC